MANIVFCGNFRWLIDVWYTFFLLNGILNKYFFCFWKASRIWVRSIHQHLEEWSNKLVIYAATHKAYDVGPSNLHLNGISFEQKKPKFVEFFYPQKIALAHYSLSRAAWTMQECLFNPLTCFSSDQALNKKTATTKTCTGRVLLGLNLQWRSISLKSCCLLLRDKSERIFCLNCDLWRAAPGKRDVTTANGSSTSFCDALHGSLAARNKTHSTLKINTWNAYFWAPPVSGFEQTITQSIKFHVSFISSFDVDFFFSFEVDSFLRRVTTTKL